MYSREQHQKGRKEMKRLLSFLLALVMVLGLTGCTGNSFEMRMIKAVEQQSKLKSLHTDMETDISMSVTVMGQAVDVDLVMKGASDAVSEPPRSKTEMDIAVMGSSQKILTYTEQLDGYAMLYTSADGGKTWQKQRLESGEIPQLGKPENTVEQLKLLAESAKSFEMTGTESIRGSEATVYSGVLEGETVEEAIRLTGILQNLRDQAGIEVPEELFQNLGGIPVTIAIDNRSGRIVRYTMELTELMQSLMTNAMEELFASQGFGSLDLQIETKSAVSTVELSQFDSVGEIVIPEAARK